MIRTGAVLAALLASGVLVGCGTDHSSAGSSHDCAFLMSEARSYISGLDRYEDLEAPMEGGADWVIEELKSECPSEFSRVRSEAAQRARSLQGAPDLQVAPEDAGPRIDDGDTRWNEARDQVGVRRTVCGPLVNDGQSDDDVFLNLGRGYPDPDRFTVVIWDVGEIEEIPPGTKVCASGTISSYQGVAQIEAPLGAVAIDLP